MSARVPFQVEQTGNAKVDRNLYNVSQAVRQLQEQVAAPTNVSTAESLTIARQSTVTITSAAVKPVVVSLPLPAPANQQTRIVNQSNYAAKVRTTNSMTVFGDIPVGESLTVVGNGINWSAM